MRTLVVEDEPGVQRFLKRGLEEEGYVIDVASDGQEALELANASPYDIIILDVMLCGCHCPPDISWPGPLNHGVACATMA